MLGSGYFTENFQVKENEKKKERYSFALLLFAFLGVKIRV